jgi:hypothetical protein
MKHDPHLPRWRTLSDPCTAKVGDYADPVSLAQAGGHFYKLPGEDGRYSVSACDLLQSTWVLDEDIDNGYRRII